MNGRLAFAGAWAVMVHAAVWMAWSLPGQVPVAAAEHTRTQAIDLAPDPAPVRQASRDIVDAVEAVGAFAAGEGPATDYTDRVRAHLLARMPSVKALGQAELIGRVGRDGRVRSVRVVQASGGGDVPRAALQWLRDAEPLPSPPTEMTLRIPLRFRG